MNAPDSTPVSNSLVAQTSGPRATLAEAHDSNVWALAFHPLGHLLASASNDHTTRFWARERPGDSTSTFSGGGARPPAGAEEDVDEGEGEDEDQVMVVPGLMSFADGIPGIDTSFGVGQQSQYYDEHGRTDMASGGGQNGPTGVPGMGSGMGMSASMEDVIPGFGRQQEDPRASNNNSNHRPPLPVREQAYGDGMGDERSNNNGRWGGDGYRERERDRPYGGRGRGGGGGGGRSDRWNSRRGGNRY